MSMIIPDLLPALAHLGHGEPLATLATDRDSSGRAIVIFTLLGHTRTFSFASEIENSAILVVFFLLLLLLECGSGGSC